MDRRRRARIVVLRSAGVARLPYEHHVAAEQGMLQIFGRIMPVLMPLSGVLAIALIIASRGESIVLWLRVGAALCIGATVITTLAVNVPLNTQAAAWQLTNDAADGTSTECALRLHSASKSPPDVLQREES
jgi:uncharacterized membrane protein